MDLARICRRLQALDQAGIDQQTIEAPSLGPAGARIECATAALEDLLLLGEGGVERHPGGLQHDQREVCCIERIESRGHIYRHEIDDRTPHAGAGGCGRSSAISRGISWNICYMC